MITSVVVVARAGRGGTTAFDALDGQGSVVPRRTGENRVHLVSTTAGPLGGDAVHVRVHVGAGTRLELRSVSAAQALPGRDGGPSTHTLDVTVEEGALLDLALQPLVVAAGAAVHATVRLDVAAGAALVLDESVVLGRWRESPGRWRGAVEATLAGRPWLRQSLTLGPGSPSWDALLAPRVLLSRLRSPGPGPSEPDARHGLAVRAQLAAGGTLVTAVGPDLASAVDDAEALGTTGTGRRPSRQPSGDP